MKNRRWRALIFAGAAVACVWAVVWTLSALAQHSRMTGEKIKAYASSMDLAKLSGANRAAALRKYAEMINALSIDERRNWRRGDDWRDWFAQMTEAERAQFLEATLPTGFKQMLDSFAQLPDDRRKQLIDETLKNLRENPIPDAAATNNEPPLSPELEQKVRQLGLRAYYSQSSAETKAELAPVLEELEHQMATRGGRRGG